VLTSPVARATAPSSVAVAELTGGDVLAYRKGRGLTQTQLASEWQVTQGTIARAEGVPSKALGPSLQVALAGARRK
jgi:DNA-binding XRE family transcriptional regulator